MSWNYIIGVRYIVNRDFKIEFNLDSLIKYESLDKDKVDYVKSLIDNVLTKTTLPMALQIAELEIPKKIQFELNMLSIIVRSNKDITVHHFTSEDEIEDEFFNTYIK